MRHLDRDHAPGPGPSIRRVCGFNGISGEEEARAIVEHLNRDPGYEPVHAGPIENAAAQERLIPLIFYEAPLKDGAVARRSLFSTASSR